MQAMRRKECQGSIQENQVWVGNAAGQQEGTMHELSRQDSQHWINSYCL